MIITQSIVVKSADPQEYAWASLKKFQNIQFVSELITKLHKVDKKHARNATKQARQLRYCLIQAQEYYKASKSVSLATKPNLLYYSLMSLALAEVLLKGSGDLSLDKVRSENKHHGLTFSINSNAAEECSLEGQAGNLIALPMYKEERATGTFNLWHKFSREMPVVGSEALQTALGGQTISYAALLTGADVEPKSVNKNGISLLECFQHCPGMHDFLPFYGIGSQIIRGSFSLIRSEATKTDTSTLIIHPARADTLKIFYDNVKAKAEIVNRIDGNFVESGGTFQWTDPLDDRSFLMLPGSSMWHKNEIRFWPYDYSLNEFGIFYIGMYILGNYARYYPDKWLLDVESSSLLALATEEFIRLASYRIPLLALSELSRIYYILDA